MTNNFIPPMRYVFRTPPLVFTCFLCPTNPSEVAKIIKWLKNKGSKILDIHPTILKENCQEFSCKLSYLYNLSVDEGEFPSKSKIGRVTPVHKGGPTNVMDNYRPISVLPVFSKIFEKLTFIRMLNFINLHKILTPCQFGFRSGHNTTLAIVKFISYLLPAYHAKVYSACFFLDLRKAFDLINHDLLLLKLSHYGFRGRCFEYLKSYFSNRKQYVYIDGQASDMKNVTHGVPQGSILGPLCFNLFINDLPLAVDVNTVLFADDAAFVITAPTLIELYSKIRKLFNDLSKYLGYNGLVANSKKSKLMMFSSRPSQILPEFIFEGDKIDWVEDFKYLGLTITNKLSFSRHISRVTLNLSRITGMFINLRNMVPKQLMVKLYYALAYPHLINHIILWGSAPACHLHPLSVRLNNLLRIILGIHWINGRPSLNTIEMYKSNNFLNIDNIFRLYIFKLLKQLLDGEHPEFFSILLEPYLTTHSYETRGGVFRHPALVCEVERRALPFQLITLYDNVPQEILNRSFSSSVRNFKKYLLSNM